MKKIVIFVSIVILIFSCYESNNNEENIISDEEAILEAVQNGDYNQTKLLLDIGVDVNTKSDTRKILLNYASKNGSMDIVKLLIDYGSDIDGNLSDPSPLMEACWNEHIDIVKYLVEKGADINLYLEWGSAVSYASNYEILKYLIDNGASYETITASHIMVGFTALHRAAERNDIESINLLIDKGFDVNVQANNSTSPLGVAVMHNHFDSVKLLVENGADIHQLSSNGKSIFDNSKNKEEIHNYFLELGL
jgi:ankyrin repeat protein